MTLTEAGERFVPHAREAVAAAERAAGAIAAHRRERAGTLRIGFIAAAAGRYTRPILDRRTLTVPRPDVQLVQLAWSEQADLVVVVAGGSAIAITASSVAPRLRRAPHQPCQESRGE